MEVELSWCGPCRFAEANVWTEASLPPHSGGVYLWVVRWPNDVRSRSCTLSRTPDTTYTGNNRTFSALWCGSSCWPENGVFYGCDRMEKRRNLR